MSCKRRRGRERRRSPPSLSNEITRPRPAGPKFSRFFFTHPPPLPSLSLPSYPRVSCPIFHGGNPTTVARARSITWRRLRGNKERIDAAAYRVFVRSSCPSLCVIFARAVWSTTRCYREGRSVWRSFSFRILEIPWRDSTTVTFCLFIFPRELRTNCASFRGTSLCRDEWTRKSWFASEREFRKKEKSFHDPLSVYLRASRILSRPFEVCMTDYIHVFLCASAGLLAFFESCGENSPFVRNYHRITEYESFFFFFFLCCVLCELCFTLCNRENDCESRITVEFELWIRKRGKKMIT